MRKQVMKKGKPPQKGGGGQLRIIGGEWRSRRLPILNAQGLRPTPDRVRETLFNWLQFEVQGAYCLDLFAGSGALGLEALSRGAQQVVLVEKNMRIAQQLKDNVQLLGAANAQVHNLDALQYLRQNQEPFDLIFLDPPFRKGLLPQVLDLLEEQKMLKVGGWLYLEFEQDMEIPINNGGYKVFRETQAGDVRCLLLRHEY